MGSIYMRAFVAKPTFRLMQVYGLKVFKILITPLSTPFPKDHPKLKFHDHCCTKPVSFL